MTNKQKASLIIAMAAMLEKNPDRQEAHPEEDWVVENYMDRVKVLSPDLDPYYIAGFWFDMCCTIHNL